MTAKTLNFIFLALLLFGFLWVAMIFLTFRFEYGNRLILENHVTKPIDSINVWVCKDQATFTPWYDSTGVADLSSFADNIDPAGDYDGCAIIFTVYTPDKTLRLAVDAPFTCSGCDVNHYYLLTDSAAYHIPWGYYNWAIDSVFTPS